MPEISIIKYKDKEILYFNHNGLRDKELLENIKRANKKIKEYTGKEALTLANFTNAITSNEVMDYLKSEETVAVNKKVNKAAVVGITGIKKIFLNVFNSFTDNKTKAFDTEEEAKEYLVK